MNRSTIAIGGLVILLALLPIGGVAMAFYTGKAAWLLLCFALALFL